MKFTVSQDSFSRSLSIVNRVIQNRATLPVLSCVLFDLEGDRLTLIGSNLEMAFKVVVKVQGEEDGICAVPARLLSDYVGSLPKEEITVSSEENSLRVKSSRTKTTFAMVDTSEYPEVSFDSVKDMRSLPEEHLGDVVDRVAFAASSDEARVVLMGVYIKTIDTGLEMAATDGFRLSVEKVAGNKVGDEMTMLIPAKGFLEVGKLARELSGKNAGNLQFGVSREGSHVIFNFGDEIYFASRLLEGTFPPYGKIIPTSYATRGIFDGDELSKAVRTASLFAKDTASVLKMTCDPSNGLVRFSAATEQVGSYAGELPCKLEGSANEIAFNSRYLLEFLSRSKGGEVVFEMNSDTSPGVWRLSGVDEYVHVIMPVRVKG